MNKKKILVYSKESMEHALIAVKNGVSVAAAIRTYDVPRTTLYYKITGKYPEERKMGPSTYLTSEEESGLVTWLLHMSKCGFPTTKEQLLDSVEMIIKKLERKTPFVEQWQNLYRKVLEEKQKLEKEKLERKRQREEKANEKENIKKKKIKWQCNQNNSTEKTKSHKEPIKESKENSNSNVGEVLSKKGSYVIVNYEGEHCPGKILDENTDEVFVTVMEKTGYNGWKWPGKPLWYKKNDVIRIISQPRKINNRGVYCVHEMKDFEQFVD